MCERDRVCSCCACVRVEGVGYAQGLVLTLPLVFAHTIVHNPMENREPQGER
jgi:hypothetical protein